MAEGEAHWAAKRAELPAAARGGGGVLTPAAALGGVLERRLGGAGLVWEDGYPLGSLPGAPDEEAEAAAVEAEAVAKEAW